MSTNGEGTPETARIERDLAQTRSRLDATIDALQDKLSPGQMVDQAVSYLKDSGGGEFGRNLSRSVTEHPLPVALIGVGVAWLMAASARGSAGTGDVEAFPAGSTPPAPPPAGGGRYRVGPAYPAPAVGGSPGNDARGVYGRGAAGGSGAGGDDARRLTRDPRERDDLAAHGAYASAALEDLATKAHAAGSGVSRDAGEEDDAYEGRVHAARGAVLGLKRSLDETIAGFRERVDAAVAAAADAYARARASLSSSATGGGGDTTTTTKGGRSAMSSLYERGRDAAEDVYDYGRRAAGDAYDYGRAAVGGVAGSVSGGAGTATRGARGTISYIQDQPLLLGAIGVSLGAVLAMLVPPTRYERQLAGQLGEGVRGRAREAAGEAVEGATRVARAVMDTARDAAGREGLTDYSASGLVSAAREQVAEAAGRVRSVVEEAASAGREALERELDAAKDEVASPPAGGGAGAGTGTAGHGGGPLGGQQQQKRDPAGGGSLA
jgi:hypothetical protein